MTHVEIPNLAEALAGIRGRAQGLDLSAAWPDEDLRALAGIGAMRWAAPARCGGEELSALELHLRYEAVAAVSLSTALILTQRDSAIGFLDGGDNAKLADELLPALAEDRAFATIGIAQLTTSRQGATPALRWSPVPGGLEVEGIIPWSTGAAESQYLIAGASAENGSGEQVLFVLRPDQPGVTVAPPMPLVALRSTRTTSVACERVRVEADSIIGGPRREGILNSRRTNLPIGQSFLAMGHARGAIRLLREHTSPKAQTTADTFEAQLADVRRRVLDYCNPAATAHDGNVGAKVRGACNELALRVSHAAVSLYKGSALMESHPAQRLAREAMFLLVWSCPDAVISCTLDRLASE